jgi:sigma-B regulation protein RsbU (phosphoserine phosphatase)
MEGRRRWDEVRARREGVERGQGRRPALEGGYWAALQALFTRDVSGAALLDFVQHEPHETLRFLSRDLDLPALARMPWHRRYPLTLWRVFLATAHRLSPPRRLLFAIAVPLLLISWLDYLVVQGGLWRAGWPPLFAWLLAAATLLLFLLVVELRDKLSLKGDLEIARQIQFGLLPFEPFDRDGLCVRVTMRPANTVGGDYFDVVPLGDGRVGVAIGDVAGKGMPAALLMALLQGSLQTLLTAGLRGAALMAKLNEHLCAQIPSNRLVTLFFAESEPGADRLRYVNAGHNPPLLFRGDGSVRRLEATGLALGILPDAVFEETTVELLEGDRLLLYTDGVTEAMNEAEDEYGEARLTAWAATRRGLDPHALVEGVVTDVLSFCGSARPADDMTVLSVERTTSAAAIGLSAPAPDAARPRP